MYYYKKDTGQTCFLCDKPAETGDHIPPKGLFTTSLRKECNFLEVPACRDHNHGSKKDDEYFRTVIATGSPFNPSAIKLIEERILKGSKGLISQLHQSMSPVNVQHPDGKIEQMYKFEINKPRFQVVVEKIIRGLYWHHNGHRVPDGIQVSPYLWNYNWNEHQKNEICALPIRWVGHPEVFEYRYGEVEGNKNKVFLAMSFYRMSHFVYVTLHDGKAVVSLSSTEI